MRIYSVHVRRHGLDVDRDVVLVKEGFCWPAFLAAAPWALWHRHWLAAAVLVAIPLGIAGFAMLTGLNPGGRTALGLGWAALVGMLANDYRRHRLDRQGFIETGMAAGRNADAALLDYLTNEPDPAGQAPA